MAGDIQSKLKEGINAARIGDKATARRLLIQVTSADPRNEVAYMWLASVTDDLGERRRFLQRALELNPSNARAREALNRLGVDTTRAAQDRQTVNNLRQMQAGRTPTGRTPPVTTGAPQPINPLMVLIGTLVVLVVITLVVFLVVAATANQGSQAQPTDIVLVLTATQTALPSPTPYEVPVTRDPNVVASGLPPSWTPTASPTPSRTPLPSATPIPLNTFTLLYIIEDGELFQANGEGADARRIGEQVRDVAYDRTGTRLAFVRDVPCATDETITAPEIFVASTSDVANAVQITTLCVTDTGHPSWGPDGVSIAYYTNYGGDDTEIFTMTDDGQNQRAITENDVNDSDPVWSPDGTLIAFVRDSGTPDTAPDLLDSEIFSIQMPDALPESITQLTNDESSSYAPEFSHDGAQIVFVSDRGGDGDIYVMDARGDGETLLTAADEGAEDRAPVFTPDGRSIVFLSNRDGETFQMYLMDVRFTNVTALPTVTGGVAGVAFKPEAVVRRLGT